jgi:hypothetical protein
MKKTFVLLLFILLLTGIRRVLAQADTLASMRQFLRVCNDYKRLPVQLEVEIRGSSNLVLAATDTARMTARFILCNKGSYISMDGLEQLANDSLMLVVNPATKRMQLYPNRQSVAVRMQQLRGRQLRDSSVAQLAAKYIISSQKQGRDTALIRLGSRTCLPHTTFPLQELQVDYDPVTQRPFAVSQLERSLVSVSDSLFRAAAARPEWTGKTVSVHDSNFYLVREQTQVFYFQRIDHQAATDPPVRISDRITADLTGGYRPVKDFAAFRLTQQVQ